MAERSRQFERVDAVIPVRVEGGVEGTTRNLSPGGLFFVVDKEIKSGGSIHLTIEFDNPSGKFFLDCVAEIVRVEETEGKLGVAAKIVESRMERRLEIPKKQGVHA
jgi:hypothetical protein